MRQKITGFYIFIRYVRGVLQSDFNNNSKIYTRIKLRNYFFLMCGLINFITISTLLKEIFSSENLSGKWDSISDLPDFRGYIYVSGKPKTCIKSAHF